MLTGEFENITSKKAIKANKVVKVKQDILKIWTPLTPKTLPKKPLTIAAKKGKKIMEIYIIDNLYNLI